MKPKPSTSTEWLAKLFLQIYDDYFIKLDNPDAKRYIELVNLEAWYEQFLIPTATGLIHFLWSYPADIWRTEWGFALWKEQVDEFNTLLDTPIDTSGNVTDEIERALNVEIGMWKNDLSECKMELEQLRAQVSKTAFEYYDSVQNINEANGSGLLRSDCLLAEYVAAEKSAIRKSERAKQKQIA